MAVVLLCVRERERVPLTRGTRSLSLIVSFVSFLSHLYSENQMPIENNVKAMFNSLNTAFAQAQPRSRPNLPEQHVGGELPEVLVQFFDGGVFAPAHLFVDGKAARSAIVPIRHDIPLVQQR